MRSAIAPRAGYACPGRKCTSVRPLWRLIPSLAAASGNRHAARPTLGMRQLSHPAPDHLAARADIGMLCPVLGAAACERRAVGAAPLGDAGVAHWGSDRRPE
jgi:hypothetical protein